MQSSLHAPRVHQQLFSHGELFLEGRRGLRDVGGGDDSRVTPFQGEAPALEGCVSGWNTLNRKEE